MGGALVAPEVDGHVRTCRSEAKSNGAPNAAASAGDERHAPRE
jgi:hypothetical protein